jgi:hypothetical protein
VTARSSGRGEGRVLKDAWARISRCLEGRWQRVKWGGELPASLNHNLTFWTLCLRARLMERRRRVLNADGHFGSPGRESHFQCLEMARGTRGWGGRRRPAKWQAHSTSLSDPSQKVAVGAPEVEENAWKIKLGGHLKPIPTKRRKSRAVMQMKWAGDGKVKVERSPTNGSTPHSTKQQTPRRQRWFGMTSLSSAPQALPSRMPSRAIHLDCPALSCRTRRPGDVYRGDQCGPIRTL